MWVQCLAMQRSSRLTNVFFTFLGAASVGLVVAVLAIAGVLGGTTERVIREVPRDQPTATVSQPRAAGSVAEIYAQTSPGVAFIEARGAAGGGTGSGFLLDAKGHVVTNDHVVEGSEEFTVRLGEDGDALDAELVGKDPSTDLAVLRVDPKKVSGETRPLELASSSELRPGDTAIAIGSPFGLSGTVTSGIISALDREIESPNGFPIAGVLQTDAAINPGNSGGPLLDAEGRVIGVNSQIASSSRQSSGVGFAVPVDTVKEVVPQLISGGEIERAYLGVSSTIQEGTEGAVVAAITADGPAAATDLRQGDVIVKFGDRTIDDPSDLSAAVLDFKPGDEVEMTVERGGDQRTIEVQLGTRPDQGAQG
jgi:putative serine protease PepD